MAASVGFGQVLDRKYGVHGSKITGSDGLGFKLIAEKPAPAGIKRGGNHVDTRQWYASGSSRVHARSIATGGAGAGTAARGHRAPSRGGNADRPGAGAVHGTLVRLIGAKRCIELGTYTGYSALAVALALPPDGSIVACDVSDEFTRVGRPFWREAGVESKIDLRIAPALRSLDDLLAQPGGRGGYDFAFVDADKGNYIAYYEKLLELVRPGGLIAVDNTLGLSGQYVTDLTTAGAQAIRDFNTHVPSRQPGRTVAAADRRGPDAATASVSTPTAPESFRLSTAT